MQHPAIVLRAGHEQDQSLDIPVELLPMLAAEELLKVVDARFRYDAYPHAAHLHEDIPRPLIAGSYGRLEPPPDRSVEPREEPSDERNMRHVPETACRRKELDPHLEPNDPGDARRLHEVRMRRSSGLIAADGPLRDAGGSRHARLAQSSRQARIPQLIREIMDQSQTA
jgi:hypothetical protein